MVEGSRCTKSWILSPLFAFPVIDGSHVTWWDQVSLPTELRLLRSPIPFTCCTPHPLHTVFPSLLPESSIFDHIPHHYPLGIRSDFSSTQNPPLIKRGTPSPHTLTHLYYFFQLDYLENPRRRISVALWKSLISLINCHTDTHRKREATRFHPRQSPKLLAHHEKNTATYLHSYPAICWLTI